MRSAAPKAPSERPPPSTADVRASRVYLLSRGTLGGLLRRAASIAALVVLDVAGLALGLYAALLVRQLVYGETTIYWSLLWREGPQTWLPFLAPITVLLFLQAGLYASRERRPGPGRVLGSLVLVALVVLAFGLGTDYDFHTTGLIPTAVVTSSLAIGLLRAAYDSAALELMRLAGIRRRVILVGDGDNLRRLRAALASARGGIPYEFLGAVSPTGEPDLPVLASSLDDLTEVLESVRPDELVLSENDFDERTVLQAVERAHRSGVKVRLAPTTTELLVRDAEYVPGQGVPLFELSPPALTGADWALKRSFDVVASGAVLLVGLPFWALIAIAIKLDSRGPVLFVDRRVGLNEREFGMIKFRTMYEDAPERQQRLEAENQAGGALFKLRDDPRVTPFGRVLRRFSIDEVPQVLNVLRGQMSLVGPRPLPLRDHALLRDWHKARYNVLPGMTGLWQISGRSGLSFDDLVRLDFTYLENWSIWLDVTIIAKTIPAVISGRGAY
jgi:exopolysaccharide biosynthesis polyprenyl glycosylphosphotransferase